MKIKSTTWIMIGTIAFVVVGITWLAMRPRPGVFVSSLGNMHLGSVAEAHDAYNSIPPTSGPHLGGKAAWGISDTQISDELQLHNLEDGGVIVHYDPERTDQETQTALETIVRRFREKVILEPYTGMDTPIALTAWTRIEKLEGLDEARILAFIEAFRGIDHHAK